jgi:hypothetical protein
VASTQFADDQTLETELYDYSTPSGAAELDNLQDDPRIPALRQSLVNDIIPNELRAPLPGALGAAQDVSRVAYLAYDALIRNLPPPGSSGEDLRTALPFGVDF